VTDNSKRKSTICMRARRYLFLRIPSRFVNLLLALGSILPLGLVAAEFPDSADIGLIKRGIDLTFREEYPQAESLFISLKEKYPQHPCGPFFLGATHLAEMTDHEHFSLESEFYEELKGAMRLADQMRRADEREPWACYFMGMANLYWAIYDARKGNKWSVLQKGIRGKNLLKRALELDSGLIEAHFGLGSYHYWGSVKTRGYEWLPFIGDNRKQGKEELVRAAHESLFSGTLARSALVHLYIQEKEFASAEALADSLMADYPQGKAFLWAKAQARFEAGDYRGALEVYDSLDQRLAHEQGGNNYNHFQVSYLRLRCLYELGERQQARDEIEHARSLTLSPDVRKRLKKCLRELDKYENLLESEQPLKKTTGQNATGVSR